MTARLFSKLINFENLANHIGDLTLGAVAQRYAFHRLLPSSIGARPYELSLPDGFGIYDAFGELC